MPILLPSDTLSEAEERAVWSDMERMRPELWRRCYPKIYDPYKTDVYCSSKQAARTMLSTTLKIEHGLGGQSEQFEIMWASMLAERRVPTYWVSSDLAEAVMRTTPPVTLDWYNMKMPHEAAVFMLPKGSIEHPKEGDVQFVSYGRFIKDRWINSLAGKGPKQYSSANGSMLLFSKTHRYFTHYNLPYEEFPIVDLKDIDEAISRYEYEVHSSGWLGANMDKDDTRVGIKTAHLIFGLLLLMLRKPELVSEGKLINKVRAREGQAPKEFWKPSIIGEHYRLRRVPQQLGGTHASPRGHWVRGFWKDVHYGKANAYIKDMWIEPYWRGGEDE